MNSRVQKLVELAMRVVPVDPKRVLFYSCLNQYNDNPKYILEEAHKTHPDWKLIWATGKLDSEMPDYLQPVRYGSLAFCWQKARAKIWVDNGYGLFSGYASGIKQWLNTAQKKKGQFNISTWHGTPLKCIGTDAKELSGFDVRKFYSSSDMLVTSSDYEKIIFKKVTNGTIPILVTGYARNDRLFLKNPQVQAEIKKKLNWSLEDKILLYAPTYRDDDTWSAEKELDMICKAGITESLKKKFGGKWKIAVRMHQISRQKSETAPDTGTFLDANVTADMTDCLIAADALLTDYSGSLFDSMLCDLPCFLYVPDYERYRLERGMYLSLEQLPMAYANTPEQLLKAIEQFEPQKYKEDCRSFLKKNGFSIEGRASENAVHIIEEWMEKGGRA